MRILAVVNPIAGNGSAKRVLPRILQSVAGRCDVATTRYSGHARQLARTAAADGYDRVVAIGGDGTVNEVANGLAHSQAALGIVPLGTGNDSATNLGIPRDSTVAINHAITAEPRPIDLGQVTTAQGSAYFVSVAGFGFDAAVAWRVNRMPKLIGGTLPYVAGVVLTLWQYRASGVRMCVDGRMFDRAVFMAAVANNPSYGGGMRIAPHARPDDGLLEVCLVSDLSRFEVLRMLPKLYSGGHVGNPAVEMISCQELTAEGSAQIHCHADGELVGALPAQFRIWPNALRCVTGTS